MIACGAIKKSLLVATAVATTLLAGCSSQSAFVDSFLPEDTKIVVQRVAKDIPLPEAAAISLAGTAITGSGNNWVGRIELTDAQTPGALTRFFVSGAVSAGWTLTTSTIARTITLNFQRNGRKATILIDGVPENSGGGGFFGGGGSSGDGRTRVTISVNHEGAVEDQTPFRDLIPGVGAMVDPSRATPSATVASTEDARSG